MGLFWNAKTQGSFSTEKNHTVRKKKAQTKKSIFGTTKSQLQCV